LSGIKSSPLGLVEWRALRDSLEKSGDQVSRNRTARAKQFSKSPCVKEAHTLKAEAGSHESPLPMIEGELSPPGQPVLGLYLHVAYMMLMSSFEARVGQGEITPNLIGALAIVRRVPGTNQATLARMIGIERATVGEQVSRLIRKGFLRRDTSPHDARSYALYITRAGERMLEKLRERIPSHERDVGVRLTLEERKQLRALLDKFVYG
jgi:DNA-binding MarR family transcriptional regulator